MFRISWLTNLRFVLALYRMSEFVSPEMYRKCKMSLTNLLGLTSLYWRDIAKRCFIFDLLTLHPTLPSGVKGCLGCMDVRPLFCQPLCYRFVFALYLLEDFREIFASVWCIRFLISYKGLLHLSHLKLCLLLIWHICFRWKKVVFLRVLLLFLGVNTLFLFYATYTDCSLTLFIEWLAKYTF